jgi:hypothetical protein
MNLLRFEIADVRLEQCDLPLDDVDAALTAGLRDITRGAIGEGRARMRLSRQVALHSSDFDLESFLSLFLGYRADAQANPNPEISPSMNRRPSVRTVMPGLRVVAMSSSCRAEGIFEGPVSPGKLSTSGLLIGRPDKHC